MIEPLRRRPFRLLFSGQLVSNVGDWLDFLALVVLIAYTWHRGPGSLAALSVTIAIPWAIAGPLLGVLVDRWPKRPVLVASDLLRACIVTGLIFAPSIWVLLPLVFAKTLVSTAFAPAQQATIRAVVPEDGLMAANSLSQLATQVTKIVGPAFGGLIVAAWSPRVAFGVDAVTFLLSAAILSRLPRIDLPTAPTHEATTFVGELRAGLSHILRNRAIAFAVGAMSATVFLVFTFDTLSPLALRALGFGPSLFGIAVAGIGFGAVAGALAIGSFARRIDPFDLLGGSKTVAGLLVALIGVGAVASIGVSAYAWLPVVLGIGLASAGVLVSFPTILQLETPPELVGRVFGTAGAIPTALQMGAPILGAAVASAVGVGWVLLVAGSSLAVLGLVVLRFAPRLNAPEAAAPGELGLGLGLGEPDVVAHFLSVSRPSRQPEGR